MRELKLRLPDDEAIGIDLMAHARGITRAECLRQLIQAATTNGAPIAPSPAAYHATVTAIHRQLRGAISRSQAEYAAAIAINTLHEYHRIND